MPFAATWMDLEMIVLSEVRQRQIYAITYLWNLKQDTMNFTKRKETQRRRKQTYGHQRERGEINQEFGIHRNTPLYIK